ncbi:MAG: MOSC domain-containing protein [Dehalococcoidia bacterium]|nr:MOSC domain-containing protein [Dehalococcoidia bacterium]
MPRVAALYRYPVKGFTPESCESLTVQPDGRIQGDRVLAFRLQDADTVTLEDGSEWWPKREMICLQEYPGIARMRLRYDDAARRVTLTVGGAVLAEGGLDEAGQRVLTEAVAEFTRVLPEAARVRRPGALPLVLEGDGVSARFQDRPRGFVTLHGRGSLQELAQALGQPDLDETRFRSNIAVEGLAPWSELGWTGRVRVGAVEFNFDHTVIRCLATHANPDTGERDAEVLTTLTRTFGQEQPAFGVLMLPSDGGGTIRVGDEVEVLG